ncbi:MAG: NAD(P)H-hydrate epimerase [Phycisphaerae bacterium]
MPTPVFSRDALRELDRRAVEEFHIPILLLMENAGRAVADAALRHLHKSPRHALVLAGPGNNGGDGLVAARHLHNAGVTVHVLLLALHDHYRDAAATQLAIVDAMKLKPLTLSHDHAELRDWLVEADPGDLIIDALFGTGLSRPVEGLAADVIRAANTAKHPILAVDIPSGLDADTGQPHGVAIHATETVSFCGTKRGFANAQACTGKVTIADIGAPRELLQQLAQK